MKVAINSKTSGKFRMEMLNSREHIVTNMVPIVGDIIMNGGLYPDLEVTNSFQQLDQLPAPNGHPKLAGRNISAFHPLAVNAYNTGGFIRNPTKENKIVNAEFWVDLEIANQSDDGKETVRRIQNGENIGVSTGLQLTKEDVENNEDYSWVGSDYRFDHVAILLNEEPAGGDVTKIINESDLMVIELDTTNAFSVNETKDQISVLLNANRADDDYKNYAYTLDCNVESESGGFVVYEIANQVCQRGFTVDDDKVVTLSNDAVEVRRRIEYVPVTANTVVVTQPTQKEGNNMPPTEEQNSSADKKELTVENAIALLEEKGMVVNSKEQKEGLDYFLANKSKIEALLNGEDTRLTALRKEVVENSSLTEEDVANMNQTMLVNLKTSFTATNNTARGGGNLTGNQEEEDGEYNESYAPDYSEGEAA